MMAEHQEQLKECAVQFAEVRGDIERLRNGKAEQARATEKLTSAVEALGELLNQYHHTVVAELTATKESTKSAHHRLNWLFGIVSALAAGGGLAVIASILSR